MSELQTVRDLNDICIQSVAKSDVKRFDEILADDFVCTNPDGTLLDKPQFLEQTAAPLSVDRLALADAKIRVVGDLAIIHGRTTFALKDGRSGHGWYTDVWQKRQGRWLTISAHVGRSVDEA